LLLLLLLLNQSTKVYAGELDYKAPDNGQVGYKVYIGPGQYFVITDIGNGRYQW
jgi:zeaxanthin epoxidase